MAKWFTVDIDRRDPALARLGINQGVYLERSEGKGFHVIVLLSEWTPAPPARRIAKAALKEGGLRPTTEVFPKQDRLTKETPWGNYLNLPYFGGSRPEGRRMVLDPQGLAPIPLTSWLDQVACFPA